MYFLGSKNKFPPDVKLSRMHYAELTASEKRPCKKFSKNEMDFLDFSLKRFGVLDEMENGMNKL